MSEISQNKPQIHPLMPGYVLRTGFLNSRSLFTQFLKAFYQEAIPNNPKLNERAGSVADIFMSNWVTGKDPLLLVQPDTDYPEVVPINLYTPVQNALGCLYLMEVEDIYERNLHGEISFLYVDPKYRRQGIGTALVVFAKSWALQQGYKHLGLTVLTANEPTLRLCKRLGFKPEEMRLISSLEQISNLEGEQPK